MTPETKTLINQGRRTTAMLSCCERKMYAIKTSTKYIISTIVRSVMTYGGEVWQLRAALQRRLLATSGEDRGWRESETIE